MVVTNLSVGTNGKLVIEPLPVVKKIRLQPAPTWPAMDSRSLPGLSMKMKPVARQRLAVVDDVVEPHPPARLRAAPSDFSAML